MAGAVYRAPARRCAIHKRFSLSPSMLVAILALFLAVGGVGYAATTIGSAQIKNN